MGNGTGLYRVEPSHGLLCRDPVAAPAEGNASGNGYPLGKGTAAKKKSIRTYRDLRIYNRSCELAMRIWSVTEGFPESELHSLVVPLRETARGVPASIVEAWMKRRDRSAFAWYLEEGLSGCEKIRTWLRFARDCRYLDPDVYVAVKNDFAVLATMIDSFKVRSRDRVRDRIGRNGSRASVRAQAG